MESLLGLLEFFEPRAIYENIGDLTVFYLTWAVPVIMAISIGMRVLEEGFKNMGGRADLGAAIGDVLKANMITLIYTGFGVLFFKFEIAFSSLFYEHGSFSVVTGIYADLIDTASAQATNGDFVDYAVNLTNMFSIASVSWILFYLSFLLLIFIYIFLRIAYALTFGVTYAWGLAAMPTIASNVLNISNGFTKTVIGLFIWPLIEASILMLFIPMFRDWGQSLLPTHSAQAVLSIQSLYILFFFINLMMAAIAVASAWIAYALASNQSALMGFAAPFIAAGMGAAHMFSNATARITGGATNPIRQHAGSALTKMNTGGGSFISSAMGGITSSLMHPVQTAQNMSQGISSMTTRMGDAISSMGQSGNSNPSGPSGGGQPPSGGGSSPSGGGGAPGGSAPGPGSSPGASGPASPPPVSPSPSNAGMGGITSGTPGFTQTMGASQGISQASISDPGDMFNDDGDGRS
jgi:hypothetical protein